MTAMEAFTRYLTQSYIQSKKPLGSPVFIEPPHEMGLKKEYVLPVIKPLFWIPESGIHLYLTYLKHHTERLGMTRATSDPYVLYRRETEDI